MKPTTPLRRKLSVLATTACRGLSLNDTADKAEQFITMVQTAVLSKYICDPGDGTSPMSRPMWSIEHMEDAYAVAASIPPDITAREAAEAFVRWLFNAPREPDDEVILKILLRDESQ